MNYKTMYTTNRIINSAFISPDQLIKHMTQRQSELISLIKYINLQQKAAPAGSLRITKRGNSHQYYHRIDSKDICGTYIRKSHLNLAKDLAQKDYNSRIIHEIKSELHAIDSFLLHYNSDNIEHIYNSMTEARKGLINPIFLSDKVLKEIWESVEYESLDFAGDAPDLYTDNGELVRSKSEIIIANRLHHHNILYKYEFPLTLPNGITTHPDFTCLNINTRREIIWEHFGMMDDENYCNKTLKKINDYAKAGYVLGDNFIATFESASVPINSHTIEASIKQYLLE